MGRKQKQSGVPEMVTATEVASFVYCNEAWRLERLELEPGNRAALDAGTRHHEAKAAAEQTAGGLITVGRVLFVVAILALLAIWAFS